MYPPLETLEVLEGRSTSSPHARARLFLPLSLALATIGARAPFESNRFASRRVASRRVVSLVVARRESARERREGTRRRVERRRAMGAMGATRDERAGRGCDMTLGRVFSSRGAFARASARVTCVAMKHTSQTRQFCF